VRRLSTKWDGVERWYQLARMFLGEEFFDDFITAKNNNHLPCADVYHSRDEVIVVVDLPGIEDIGSLDARIAGNNLVLKGTFTPSYQGYESFLCERKRSAFQKIIPLGTAVSNKKTFSRYRKGVLEIRFPKLKSDDENKIVIK
jgi:HSP20 family protein